MRFESDARLWQNQRETIVSAILLSIDLEDVRDWVRDGLRYKEAVPVNTRRYLECFGRWNVKATFFTVGTVARRYPALIREISEAGHELACHGDTHVQVDKLNPVEFRQDLQDNIAILEELSGQRVCGFRAPTFSLIKKTAWAHGIMAELGLAYSSSVLPARNPLYGWPEFGMVTRRLDSGLWELPITLNPLPGLSVPIAGGVYFRVLPFSLTRWAVKQTIARGEAVGTYFHPYDIDEEQEPFMHPDLDEKRHLNMLMYIGRKKLLKRLAWLSDRYPMMPYRRHVSQLNTRAG
jgi:polysaccharide deacetylase family protein (PEP-CTERM system associated)